MGVFLASGIQLCGVNLKKQWVGVYFSRWTTFIWPNFGFFKGHNPLFWGLGRGSTSVALATERSEDVWLRAHLTLVTLQIFMEKWPIPNLNAYLGCIQQVQYLLVSVVRQTLECWHFLTFFPETDRPTDKGRHRSSELGA